MKSVIILLFTDMNKHIPSWLQMVYLNIPLPNMKVLIWDEWRAKRHWCYAVWRHPIAYCACHRATSIWQVVAMREVTMHSPSLHHIMSKNIIFLKMRVDIFKRNGNDFDSEPSNEVSILKRIYLNCVHLNLTKKINCILKLGKLNRKSRMESKFV